MRRLTLFLLTGFVLSLLLGCTALTGRTAGEIIDDSVITTEINAKIVADRELSYFKINVDSTSGHVVLTGFVPNIEAEARAIRLAREVRGVKSVRSELKVQKR